VRESKHGTLKFTVAQASRRRIMGYNEWARTLRAKPPGSEVLSDLVDDLES